MGGSIKDTLQQNLPVVICCSVFLLMVIYVVLDFTVINLIFKPTDACSMYVLNDQLNEFEEVNFIKPVAGKADDATNKADDATDKTENAKEKADDATDKTENAKEK